MSAHELLTVLHRLGVRVWIEGDRLEIAAPKALLTDDLRNAIRENRRDMIAILAGQQERGSVDGMNDVDLLRAVRRSGADLMINYRGRLAVRNPDLLPAELREPIRQRRDALVAVIQHEKETERAVVTTNPDKKTRIAPSPIIEPVEETIATPGLPLKPPNYEVPPEWQPAPEYTAEEQVEYDQVLQQMAEVLPDGDLVRFVASYGATLYVDEQGALRAKDAGQVPAPVREVVRARQEALVAVVGTEG